MKRKEMTKFQSWVLDNMGLVSWQLKVSHSAVYQWARGETRPRMEHAIRIIEISEKKLELSDIYNKK